MPTSLKNVLKQRIVQVLQSSIMVMIWVDFVFKNALKILILMHNNQQENAFIIAKSVTMLIQQHSNVLYVNS